MKQKRDKFLNIYLGLFDGYHFDGPASSEKATNNSGMGSQRTNSTASFSGKTSILYQSDRNALTPKQFFLFINFSSFVTIMHHYKGG